MNSQENTEAQNHLRRAEAAYDSGERELAIREYAEALANDANLSRALFRLGQLHLKQPALAQGFFERYVANEPGDAWGYMALGDVLSSRKYFHEALDAYDKAIRLRPGERDGRLGRARVFSRGGHIEAAIAAYQDWLGGQPADAEALRELGRLQSRAGRPKEAADTYTLAQSLDFEKRTADRLLAAQRASAPSVTPLAGGSRDTEGNERRRQALLFESGLGARHRLGFEAERREVRDGVSNRVLFLFGTTDTWRPSASLLLNAGMDMLILDEEHPEIMTAAGEPRLQNRGNPHHPLQQTGYMKEPGLTTPVARLRFRYRPAPTGTSVDLRAERSLVDASRMLLSDRLLRDELAVRLETPSLGALRLRGGGRFARLKGDKENNRRTGFNAALVAQAAPAAEIAFSLHRTGYGRPSVAGFFAPRRLDVVEIGSYLELEGNGPFYLDLDAGAGFQRTAKHGERLSRWQPSWRVWSIIGCRLAPGRDLCLTLDVYHGRVGMETATVTDWQWVAGDLSFSWAF